MFKISLAAETIYQLNGFPITNSLALGGIVSVVLIISAWVIRYQVALVPSGFYNAIEAVMEGLFNLVESVIGDLEHAKQYFPLIASLFVFIIVNNWAGLVPGVGSITVNHLPALRSANADLNTTLALAIVSVIVTQYYGVKASGFLQNATRFLNFTSPIMFFVGLLEGVAEFAKVVSFSFRLFGNIFAGEVLLFVIGIITPYLAPLPFIALELFVGFVQALVFAMLTLVFIKVATVEVHQ